QSGKKGPKNNGVSIKSQNACVVEDNVHKTPDILYQYDASNYGAISKMPGGRGMCTGDGSLV
ncbi:22122_t:CDS:2, partial [Rhizophagus irregularis]